MLCTILIIASHLGQTTELYPSVFFGWERRSASVSKLICTVHCLRISNALCEQKKRLNECRL